MWLVPLECGYTDVHRGCMGVPLECGYTDSALGLYGSTIRVWLHRQCIGVVWEYH